jgi:nicotinate-nucleotide adenylyltransferase
VSEVEFGVYGGSFDPPHIAHVLAANVAIMGYGLERLLIVPAYQHAFAKKLADFEDRLEMCRLAFQHLRQVEICDIERELPAPSYTLHTLQALAKRHPGVRLRLLIGTDILTETQKWHDFASVERLAPPIIVERQGYPAHDPDQPALPAVSSSEVRRRLRSGENTRGLLSSHVEDYIRARGLYR